MRSCLRHRPPCSPRPLPWPRCLHPCLRAHAFRSRCAMSRCAMSRYRDVMQSKTVALAPMPASMPRAHAFRSPMRHVTMRHVTLPLLSRFSAAVRFSEPPLGTRFRALGGQPCAPRRNLGFHSHARLFSIRSGPIVHASCIRGVSALTTATLVVENQKCMRSRPAAKNLLESNRTIGC